MSQPGEVGGDKLRAIVALIERIDVATLPTSHPSPHPAQKRPKARLRLPRPLIVRCVILLYGHDSIKLMGNSRYQSTGCR